MSRVSVPPAWFGKLPARGDFLRSAGQAALVQTLDRWLSQGIELMAADARWKEVYDRGPQVHFAFLSVHSHRAIAGHLTASADEAGRRFPFVAAGAFDVAAPLAFMPRAPLALSRLWSRFEQACGRARESDDPGSVLAEFGALEVELETSPVAYDASMQDFAELQTVGSLQTLLRTYGHAIDLRQALLALGILLRPVLGSDGQALRKGLSLPLPAEPLYRGLVASFWLDVVTPFLQRGDFEVALFLPRGGAGGGHRLAIGFAGGSAEHLHAVLDPEAYAQAFIDPTPADWVEDQIGDDFAIKKLSSYLAQPQLSLRQALETFREAFLGA